MNGIVWGSCLTADGVMEHGGTLAAGGISLACLGVLMVLVGAGVAAVMPQLVDLNGLVTRDDQGVN